MAYIGKQPAKVPLTSEDIVDDSIESADIKEGTIVNSDINAAAGIVISKLAVDPTNADNISSGTLPDARLPATLPAKSGVNLTALNATNLGSGTVPTVRLGTGTADATTFLRGDGSWQVVAVPSLDSPVISGTLAVLEEGTVTHTITNWSDDVSYTITPTNCSAGAVNGSGEFVITHTSGDPSYTIRATTASLGLDDSALVSKDITMQLTAPTLSSPADVGTVADVVYTITSTTVFDDKIILDPGTANFTYQSVSGGGTASKVGNTVECVGFTTNNPVVTIQFTAEATYSVTAKSVHIAGTYTTSANSAADSIAIQDTYDVEFLVIAGGGGGAGAYYTGGGGAGGYRTNYSNQASGGGAAGEANLPLTPGVQYTVTVGSGGAAGASSYAGYEGEDSVFGSITSLGGGAGGGDTPANNGRAGGTGGPPMHGGDGGSGGGCGRAYTGAAQNNGGGGTTGQGYDGGDNYNNSGNGNGGSGGGGAGAVGESILNGSPLRGGDGGVGVTSLITNSATFRGGGGGGSGHYSYQRLGYGGNGGGGHGAGSGGGGQGTSVPGVANTGGGGGGGNHGAHYPAASAGGSGVVILRIPDADYSGTTTGSPTIDTSSIADETILIFNADGSYTA